LVFLVLAAAVACAASAKGNNLLFLVCSVLFAMFAVCGVMTVLVARRLEVSRLLPEAATAGEPFTIGVSFRNAKRFWPATCLKFQDRMTHEGRPAAVQPAPVWLPFAKPRARLRG
jgi:uncharacterized protein (DUF58 family)